MQHVFVHLSDILKNHIDRKHICIEKKKKVQSNKCDFSAKSKDVLKHHKHLKHGEEASLICELCHYRTSNAPYLKSHMQALCKADYSCNICRFRFLGLICHGL